MTIKPNYKIKYTDGMGFRIYDEDEDQYITGFMSSKKISKKMEEIMLPFEEQKKKETKKDLVYYFNINFLEKVSSKTI